MITGSSPVCGTNQFNKTVKMNILAKNDNFKHKAHLFICKYESFRCTIKYSIQSDGVVYAENSNEIIGIKYHYEKNGYRYEIEFTKDSQEKLICVENRYKIVYDCRKPTYILQDTIQIVPTKGNSFIRRELVSLLAN